MGASKYKRPNPTPTDQTKTVAAIADRFPGAGFTLITNAFLDCRRELGVTNDILGFLLAIMREFYDSPIDEWKEISNEKLLKHFPGDGPEGQASVRTLNRWKLATKRLPITLLDTREKKRNGAIVGTEYRLSPLPVAIAGVLKGRTETSRPRDKNVQTPDKSVQTPGQKCPDPGTKVSNPYKHSVTNLLSNLVTTPTTGGVSQTSGPSDLPGLTEEIPEKEKQEPSPSLGGSVPADLADLYAVYAEEHQQLLPGVTVTTWGPAQQKQARDMLKFASPASVTSVIRFCFRNWPALNKNRHKGTYGVLPGLAYMAKCFDRLAPEAAQFEKASPVLQQRKDYCDANPDEWDMPEELREKVEAANKVMTSLGLSLN